MAVTSDTFSATNHSDANQAAGSDSPPTVVIEPGKRWAPINLGELWRYRELLYFLTWRDVKVRYKQTLLGAAWAILQPLLTMLIFTLLFGRFAGIPSGGVPYPVFAYAGLLIWTFFSNSVINSGNSLTGNANLITKVYFPRILIPTAAVAAGLVDLALAFIVQIGLMVYYRVPLTTSLAMVPVLVGMATLLALGVGTWLSGLNVKYRDIRYAIPFLIQIWMFVSPIIYPLNMLPAKWQWLLAINPLTGIVHNFRVALLGHGSFDWRLLGISLAVTLVFLIYSTFSFRRMERYFADTI